MTNPGIFRIKPRKPATRRASYLDGLDYIARNDESGADEALDADFMQGMASVQLLATLFGIPAGDVAFDVVRVRKLIAKEERQ